MIPVQLCSNLFTEISNVPGMHRDNVDRGKEINLFVSF